MSAFTYSSTRTDWPNQPNPQPRFSYSDYDTGPIIVTNASGEEVSSAASRPSPRSSQSYQFRSGPIPMSRHESSINLLAQPMRTDSDAIEIFPQTRRGALHSYHPAAGAYEASRPENGPARFLYGPTGVAQGEQMEEGQDMVQSEAEAEGTTDGTSPQTAVEGRVDKRKTNRFRLTYSQTRYLMSEFARQAHPDVAQRERLSREIPGLSSRQVQVWFQNRRAKLKRLTSDDRDRTTKSRALPDNFDMSQALRPFSSGSQAATSPPSGSLPHTTFGDDEMSGPTILRGLSLQNADENIISPVSISSAFGDFFSPTGSCSTSDGLSPISTTSDRSHFSVFPNSEHASPENMTPFAPSRSFTTAYPRHTHKTALQLHEVHTRPREALAAPPRSGSMYSQGQHAYGDFQPTNTRSPSLSNREHGPGSNAEDIRTPFGVRHNDKSRQDAPRHSSMQADSTLVDSTSVSQFSSQQRFQQDLSSSELPLSIPPENYPYWPPPNRERHQLATPYQTTSTHAPPGPFYVTQEPLEQAWIPGPQQQMIPPMMPLGSNNGWLHYQQDPSNANAYPGAANTHSILDATGQPPFQHHHPMDDRTS